MDAATRLAALRRPRRFSTLIAAGVVLIAGPVLLACSDDSGRPVAAPATTPISTPHRTTQITTDPPPNEPLATEPNETAPTTTVMIANLVRPITDPDVCVPISAEDASASGLPRSPSTNVPLTLFARPSALPVPIQIIGEPVDGPAKPFALVERIFDSDRPPTPSSELVTINGVDVFIGAYTNGNGEATWNLLDGSQGYLRSRGLDRDTLVSIISNLSPRPADAAIPGFDYGTSGPDGLQLVTERMNTPPWGGEGAGSQCRVPATGYVYRISSYRADLLWEFGAVIDRPPPLDVGMIDDSVIIIAGPDDAGAPTIADVRTADEEEWRRLLIEQPEPAGVPLPIGEIAEANVEFVPIDATATPVSSLSFHLAVEDGIAFLEIDTTDAVIAPEAEYWKIEIDGRIRSRSSAASTDAGGLMGVRLGEAPLAAPFTATVSTTDGDDLTIQTTGPILLEQVTE